MDIIVGWLRALLVAIGRILAHPFVRFVTWRRRMKLAAFLAGPVANAQIRTGHTKLVMDRWKDIPAGCSLGVGVHQCNSSACALGWATVVFPDRWSFVPYISSPILDGNTKRYDVYNEAAKFFGISVLTASKVFGIEDATPLDKAKQLRSLKYATPYPTA